MTFAGFVAEKLFVAANIRGPTGPAGVYVKVNDDPLAGVTVTDEVLALPVLGVNRPPTYSLLSVMVTDSAPLNVPPVSPTVQLLETAFKSPEPERQLSVTTSG
jgi:hypothetical protein